MKKAKRRRQVFGNAAKDDTLFMATVGDTDRNINVQTIEHAATAAAAGEDL